MKFRTIPDGSQSPPLSSYERGGQDKPWSPAYYTPSEILPSNIVHTRRYFTPLLSTLYANASSPTSRRPFSRPPQRTPSNSHPHLAKASLKSQSQSQKEQICSQETRYRCIVCISMLRKKTTKSNKCTWRNDTAVGFWWWTECFRGLF